jgi:outer membrane protein OmpA-like peptidoglycan-associated protein
MVFRLKNSLWYYHQELPQADDAIDAAQRAGKDKECPELFEEAKTRRDNAYAIYYQCRTKEAIALAKEATEMANSLCPKLAEVKIPPPLEPVESAAPAPVPVAPVPQEKIIDRMTLHIHFDSDKVEIRPRDYKLLGEAWPS